MTDILSIQSTTSELMLLHPNGSKLGLTFKMLPPDDSKVKNFVKRERDRMLKNAQKRKASTADDEERISKELAMVTVVGWEWTDENASINGAQPEFNSQTLGQLIEMDWLREQVDEHLGELKNFFPK